MPLYRVEFVDGSTTDVTISEYHAPPVHIIEKAQIERRRASIDNPTPTRVFLLAQGAVGEDIGIDRCVWQGPAPEKPIGIRIFASFVCANSDGSPGFGSTLLDIEFEPFTSEQIVFVQRLIESQGPKNVTLLQWQHVEVR